MMIMIIKKAELTLLPSNMMTYLDDK